jgi:light-regulated signal transduction histidine kinase (bacteriophytochrome)
MNHEANRGGGDTTPRSTQRRLMECNDTSKPSNLKAFSYSVSHDLRAPLRHIAGYVELLQQDAGPSLSETSLRHLRAVSHSAKRMGNLIDDLLAFSRIGQSEPQKTEVDLDQLIQETLGDFQGETKERNIAWEIRPLPRCGATLRCCAWCWSI